MNDALFYDFNIQLTANELLFVKLKLCLPFDCFFLLLSINPIVFVFTVFGKRLSSQRICHIIACDNTVSTCALFSNCRCIISYKHTFFNAQFIFFSVPNFLGYILVSNICPPTLLSLYITFQKKKVLTCHSVEL